MRQYGHTQPEVSVIISTYNQDRFIGRCIRSLLNQNCQNVPFEIIIVNDGSTDRTDFAVSLFQDQFDSPIVSLKNDINIGLPASLNRGIQKSKGKYIVRVDSDDFVNSNFINFLHFYLENNRYADAVACDYLLVDDAENILDRMNCFENPIACGIMFRRKQLYAVGLYDEDFRFNEDRELRIRFEKEYQISRLELPLYRYRRHEDNITNDSRQMEHYYKKIIKKHGANV